MSLTLVSCNVNGLRAAYKKGLPRWVDEQGPTLMGFSEVRANESQLAQAKIDFPSYVCKYAVAKRPGYSGVGIYVHRSFASDAELLIPKLDALDVDEAHPRAFGAVRESFDDEGRVVCARLGRLIVVSAYFPNGNGKDRDNSRVPYKLDFYERVRNYLESARRDGMKILVMGDFNTAHKTTDLARPKQNEGTSGFLPEERKALDTWVGSGWFDTFRHLHPSPTEEEVEWLVKKAKREGKRKADRDLHPGEGHYTWWSQRGTARAKNIGWRIDYMFATENVAPYLRTARIHADVTISDHCPISVELDERILTED